MRRFVASTPSSIIAVATRDPLHQATFSGYSRHLFTAVQQLGVRVRPVASRDLRWHDALSGAVDPVALLFGSRGDRARPLIRPDWYWSRRGFERFCRRCDRKLERLEAPRVVVQVGTHIHSRLPGTTSYCITDATIPQAVMAGQFSVSHASPRVLRQAQECQAEVFSRCSQVFVLSEWAASSVIHDYGVAPERVAVLGAGANVDRVLPRAASRSAPYVLFVGADWRQKGGPLLLDAFQLARRDVPELRLVVVGCRPSIPHAGVEVVGPLLRSDAGQYQRLLELYARATCFSILPSFDAFPNVLLEAGLFGVPVVSTREGSRPEAVLHGQTGLLASRRDAAEIANLIVRLIRDPDEADKMGRRASAWVASRFTWPLVARRLLDLIARDLEGGPP